MKDDLVIRELGPVLAGKTLLPTLTRYNRLESRPRTDNFVRALRAEVRDPLWMLCKQWQLGEFAGDDAGAPVSAKLRVHGERLTRYQPRGQPAEPFDRAAPLEATVERRSIPLQAGGLMLSLDLRLQLGRRWLTMLPASARPPFLDHYRIVAPDPTAKSDAPLCAHAEVLQQLQALAGRAMDGGALYLHLRADPGHRASDGVTGLSPADAAAADAAGPRLVAWFERLYSQPGVPGADAWQPERLEYQFACAVPDGAAGEKVLTAEEYYQGHLDWYCFDWDRSRDRLGEDPPPGVPLEDEYRTRSFLPAPVRWSGMPDTRWWAFEDGRTNFGDIKPGTTDLAKLLLIEFALVYANDWFLFPYTVPSGSVLAVEGLAVTNTFGERFWIEPAGQGADEAWQRWAMFNLTIKGRAGGPADLSLLVLPTVPKTQEGPPQEEVALVRDEMANMAWGIETVVPLATGWTRGGSIAAGELHEQLQALAGAPAPPADARADVRYDLMTTVPENWIPFVPEHLEGDNRQIQLRRGAMPRFLAGDPTFERVRPRTTLLREGLDQSRPYRIHEEEVFRAGTQVVQAYQRTRWSGGRVFTWLGVRKRVGRGEGHSGLAFDRLVPTPRK
jgi:hypothetical protein